MIGHPVFNGRPKLPGQQLTVVPWHQDSSYFGTESAGTLIATVWVPLVPVDKANGCLQVIAGSHELGLVDHHTETREGQFLEADDLAIDESRIVTCAMEPGDALLLSNLTMHRSLANVTDKIRWSLDIRYLRDGDAPGTTGWPDPTFKWVIRSRTQPVTTYEQWMQQVSAWEW